MTSAEDVVSAQAAARVQKSRVRVDSLTTAWDQTWANPDGSLTTESGLGQQRVKQSDGSWADVDLNLVNDGAGVASATPAVPVAYGGRGSTDVASLTVAGGPMVLGWDAPLPAPVLMGTLARYPEVRPGVDLLVQALRTGFEVAFEVKSAPTAPLSLPLSMTLPAGADASATADGGLSIKDSTGKELVRGATPIMFGAAKDPKSNQPKKSRPFSASLGSKSLTAGGGSRRTWTLMPDASFFTDPDVTFPVLADPGVTVTFNTDTYVKSTAASSSFDTAQYLYIGTPDAGTTKYRTLLHLNSIPSTITGMFVDEAHVRLYNSYSAYCDPSGSSTPIRLYRAYAWTAPVTWTGQPGSPDGSPQSTSYWSHGRGDGGACSAAGYDNLDLTQLARNWASGASSTKDFKVLGPENTVPTGEATKGYKQFNSLENAVGDPLLIVTYRSYPVPGKPSMTPGTSDGVYYHTSTVTPTLSAKVTSASGSSVQGRFEIYLSGTSTLVWSGLGSTVSAGGVSTVTVPSSAGLSETASYVVRVWGVSGEAVSSNWSDYIRIWPDTTLPSATTVTSSQFPSGQWTNGVASGTWSFSASDSRFDHYLWGLDTASPATAVPVGSSSVTINPVPGGWHHLYARGVDKAGNAGPVADYPFGAGSALVSPADGQVTQASVNLVGSTAPGATQASFYWRRASTDSWALIPTSKVTPGAGSPAFSGWPYTFTALSGNGASTPALIWDLAGTDANLTGPVQVGVCFGTSSTCPASPGTTLPTGGAASTPSNLTLDRNAFNVAQTSSLGPVGVNLLTGNTQFSASDVSVAGNAGTSLSVSRVLNTKTVASTPGNAALGVGNYTAMGIFGPGWTGSVPVDSAGSDWTGLVDTGSVLTLNGPDQSTVAFTPGTGTFAGSWRPTGDDADSLLVLTTSPGGDCASGYRCFTLTDGDNVQVVFQTLTATTSTGTLAAPVSFGVTKVLEPGTPGASSYTSSGGLITRLLSPIPQTGQCTASSWATATSATWQPGCRALELAYGDGSAGKPAGQLVAATYVTSDGTTPLAIDVACWGYDGNNQLSDTWDPRDIATATTGTHQIACGSTPLRATHYDYDTSGRVSKITPAWNGSSSPLAGTTISYDGSGRLSHVDRTHLDASGTETTSIAYGVPLAADGSHPEYRPDMTNTISWAQTDSPDPNVGGTVTCPPGAAQASATGDLRACSISYLDANGRTVNTASYSGGGAAGWHVSTTEFDSAGHVTRSLDASNREEALAPSTGAGAALGLPSDTKLAAMIVSTINQYAPNATDGQPDLVDTYGPFHAVALSNMAAGDSPVVNARAHTHLSYDIGSESGHPAGGSLHLQVSSVSGASLSPDAVSTSEKDQRTSTSVYAVGTDTTGWTYRTPLQTVTDSAGLNVTSQVVLDAATGLVVQSRMPNDVASGAPGGTAGTTKTVYYSKNAISGADSDCGLAPLWDGLVCKTYPADLNPAGGAPGLITTKTSYDALGRMISVVETPSGDSAHARTASTAYGFNSTITGGVSANPWANTVQQKATTGGLGTALPAQTTTFDSSTGLSTSLSDGTTADSSVYDDFGRVTAFTENTSASGAQGNTANTVYDPSTGRVSSTRDQHQRTTFTYNGGSEFRGLPTSMLREVTSSNNGSVLWSGTFTAGYDSDGRVASQTDPNGVTSTLTRDEAGQLTQRADTKSGVPWLTDTVAISVHGQQLTHSGPAGAQIYTYDNAGRLSTVQDTPAAGTCTTRTYGFDKNSNRTSKSVYPAASDGTCSTATTPVTTSSSYDAADRLLTAGTVYDTFGRTTTAPASTVTGGANLTVGYYANDLVRSQTQGSTTQTWVLDQTQQRLRSWTVGAAAKTNHYDDAGSDSPSWIAETSDGTSWTANLSDLLGSLAATVDQSGTPTFQYANIHGDVQGTSTSGAGTPTISADVDEYGNQPTGTSSPRYGWLGGKKRSSEDLASLVLMGVRLYNPLAGRFLSVDPVAGGSANNYDYASQNPITNFDLNGQWCWNQVGTTCTRYVTDRYGRTVPVQSRMRDKALLKHGITWGTLKWLISHLHQTGGVGSRVEYGGQVDEFRCSGFLFWYGCSPTGRSVYVHVIVDFKSISGKTFGLVTAYCGTGTELCPSWINNPAKR